MNKYNLTPIHDRIVFEPINAETEQVTQGGIIVVVNEVTQDLDKGTVVAVGDGKPYNDGILPMTVAVDDVIVFNKRIPFFYTHEGKRLGIIRESDVVLKLN